MLDSGDLERAKRYLDRLYRLKPRHFEGLLALGREAFLRGNHGEAGRYFGEALALKPGDVTALIWMSNLCQETGNTGEARTLLLKALPGAGARDRAGIFYSLALAELREGSSEKSLEWLEKAVSAGFDDWETLQGNEDFDAVRSDTRFRELVKAMEKAAGR
jgi:tetratricopeptide (TPR) repeat protein